LLSTYLLTMRGTPYYYMGDEIGMANIRFDDINDYKDLMTVNWYHLTKQEGGNLEQFMASHKLCARDNARTPVQWDNSKNAGFTEGTPWLRINPDYVEWNVAAQENDPDSPLNYFRALTQLRKDNLTLVYGSYKLLWPEHSELYGYTRSLDGELLLVLLNFSTQILHLSLPLELQGGSVLLNNLQYLKQSTDWIELEAYQALVIKVK
jgi:oligo-1,6-glucosidase